MADQSPYVVGPLPPQYVVGSSPYAYVGASPPPQPEPESSSSVFRCVMIGVVIAIVIGVVYVIFTMLYGGAFGFTSNPVRSDTATGWNLRSEIEKLNKLQEDFLSKLKKR